MNEDLTRSHSNAIGLIYQRLETYGVEMSADTIALSVYQDLV